MTLILSIETSTKVCSSAFHLNGKLISSSEIFVEKSHSKMITVLIEKQLREISKSMSDIDAVAVSKGPGSYTSLRIGVSTAKGICYAIEKPLIGVNTLYSMAYQVNKENKGKALLCPMIDARRMEVYCALLDADLKVVEETNAKVISENSFQETLSNHKILFFGDGYSKCREYLSKSENALFIENVYPSAENIGYLAHRKFQESKFEDIAYFEPFYLKDFMSKTL